MTRCQGTEVLEDGQRFSIYRILLYGDDFTTPSPFSLRDPCASDSLSPFVSLFIQHRRSSCMGRVSFTPNGTSTNYMLDFISHDLFRGAHSNISAIDCEGERSVVYIDVPGIVGDYPASCTIIYCMSHAANTL